MRTSIALLLALSVASSTSSCSEADARGGYIAASSEARVEITNEGVYDAGTIEVTDTIDHTFLVTNTGTRPVALGHVWKACNCTEMEVDKELLQPGESAAVHALVRFNSEDYGPRTIQAAIYESESSPSPLARITLFARVGKPAVLTFSPPGVDFGDLEPGEGGAVRVTLDVVDLVGSGGCVPELTGFDVDGLFEATLEGTPEYSEVQGHPLRRFGVQVRALPGVRGSRRATLGARMLVGDVELSDRITVERGESAWIRLARSDVLAGHMDVGQRYEFEVEAELLVDAPISAVLSQVSADWIEASWSDGNAPKLRVAVTPPAPGRLDERVVLAMGDRQVEVPLRGWVD